MAKGKPGGEMTPERRARMKAHGFQKGQSGNPKGRPPEDAVLKEQIRRKMPELIEALDEIAHNGKNEASRVKAIEAMMSYVMSKASQKVDVDVKHSVVGEFLANANKRRAELDNVVDGEVIAITEAAKDSA